MRHHRWPILLGAVVLLAACGAGEMTPGPSASVTPSVPTFPPGPSLTPTLPAPSASMATLGPTEPAPTLAVNGDFHYLDLLEVQVNSLAARIAPKRDAALVHLYDWSGSEPADKGVLRLDKGEYVSVHLGPLPIGDTVWYLVARATALPGLSGWYAPTSPPPGGVQVPAWVASSVGDSKYMTLHDPGNCVVTESVPSCGSLSLAGLGNYRSPSIERTDLFSIDWAAATTLSGTSCAFKVSLSPTDADSLAEVVVDASTTSVKTSDLSSSVGGGQSLPAGSWAKFRVEVTSSCQWALRLALLGADHD